MSTMTEADVRQLFRYEHLPAHLQEVSKPFHDLAVTLWASNQSAVYCNAHRTVMLEDAIRMLWDVKNRAVWIIADLDKK